MEEFSKGYAKAYAENIVENVDFNVKSVTLCNSNSDIVGYSVSLYDGDTPYGYINFDYTTENAIVDYCINKDSQGMYEKLEENLVASQDDISKEDCLEKIYSEIKQAIINLTTYKQQYNVCNNKYRIDYVFFTTNIKAKSYEVEDVFYSDHFP